MEDIKYRKEFLGYQNIGKRRPRRPLDY